MQLIKEDIQTSFKECVCAAVQQKYPTICLDFTRWLKLDKKKSIFPLIILVF